MKKSDIRDIFISYKNDNAGNNFADRLKADLENSGFSVYYNPDEYHSGDFPEKLREAIKSCKDFILIVSQGCISQLKEHNKIDWIREEILTAYREGKHIIPIMLSGVEMPKDKDEMPPELQFLPHIDNIKMPEQYKKSPYKELLKTFVSKPEKDDIYRDTDNSNSKYDVHKDFELILEEAKKRSPKAMYEAANMYYYGFSSSTHTTDRNFGKAYELFSELTQTENEYKAAAESMLGRMYYDGTVPGRIQSYEKALEYHRSSARNSENFGYSATRVAYMQEYARGCNFDFNEIEKYYLSFIEKGDDIIKMNLGDFYMNYGQFEKAAEMYNSMNNTNPVAEYKLGMLYKKGVLNNPIKPDYVQALYHFYNAINCEYPYPDAANQLGLLYFAPIGNFRKNFDTAQKYFEIAAAMGNCSAQYMLGYMYEFGYVSRNIPLSINYFTMAAEQGDINSYHHLAMLYQQSEVKNYHKAFKYAEISAKNSIPEGEFIFANLLYMGRGCVADEVKALEYYQRALKHGMEQAAFMIDKIRKTENRRFGCTTNLDVFISYHAGSSLHIAKEIANRLEKDGIRCWYDFRDHSISGSYAESISAAIKDCRVFVVVLNKESSESAHVLNELHKVYRRLSTGDNVHIIPFHTADTEISVEANYYIGRMHWLDATTSPLERNIEELAQRINALLNG